MPSRLSSSCGYENVRLLRRPPQLLADLACAVPDGLVDAGEDSVSALRDYMYTGASRETFFLVRALAYHLARLSAAAHVNKMTLGNLRLILSPTLRIAPQQLQLLVQERESVFVDPNAVQEIEKLYGYADGGASSPSPDYGTPERSPPNWRAHAQSPATERASTPSSANFATPIADRFSSRGTSPELGVSPSPSPTSTRRAAGPVRMSSTSSVPLDRGHSAEGGGVASAGQALEGLRVDPRAPRRRSRSLESAFSSFSLAENLRGLGPRSRSSVMLSETPRAKTSSPTRDRRRMTIMPRDPRTNVSGNVTPQLPPLSQTTLGALGFELPPKSPRYSSRTPSPQPPSTAEEAVPPPERRRKLFGRK